MTNNLNEQMREKAQLVFTDLPFDGKELMMTGRARIVLESRILNAIREAHAAGRQEILDRLPSDIEIAEAYDAKRAAVGGRGDTIHMMAGWIEAYREIKSRLTGESK